MLNLSGQEVHSITPTSDSATLIRKALSKMKCSKTAGPTGDVAEMLKAAGEEGVELERQLAKAVSAAV